MTLTKRKHKLVSIMAIFAILFTLSPASVFGAEPIEDITNHWAKEKIQDFVDNGYIKGYPNGTFKPDNNITRAEFMTIVNSAFGYTEKAEINYSDVADGSWYKDAIAIAKAAGYINGYPNGTMKPDAQITRQEAAVIVAKINDLESDEAAANTFTDETGIPAWSKGAVGACVTADIFNGYPDNSFQAENFIKRGESVSALSKALDYKNAPDEINFIVYGIDTNGFQLGLNPAIDGLTLSELTLSQVDGSTTGEAINVTVEAITTADQGETYSVAVVLDEGKTYELVVNIDGYQFAEPISFTVLTAQEAADKVNDLIEALPAVDALTADDSDEVLTAILAYEFLTGEQQALVTEENLTKLDDAYVRMESLLGGTEAQA